MTSSSSSTSSPTSALYPSPQSSVVEYKSKLPSSRLKQQDNAHHQLSDLGELELLTARFLEPDSFILAQLETAHVDAPISKTVASIVGSVGDIHDAAEMYFDTVHDWMPIVSKKQFQDRLLEKLALHRAELFLLVLSMRLCSSRTIVAKSMLYRTVKQFYFDVESAGRLSTQLLQAGILILIYELGHGIYPAAIMSVSSCARIGAVLELDRSLTTREEPGVSWIDLEERRRVWWMVVILDRYVHTDSCIVLTKISACYWQIHEPFVPEATLGNTGAGARKLSTIARRRMEQWGTSAAPPLSFQLC